MKKVKTILKRALGLVLASAMMLSAAACSSGKTPNGDKEQITLSVGIPSGWLHYGDTDKMLKEYEKISGVKLEIQAVEDDQFDNLLMAKMATNENWDVFFRYTGTQAAKYSNLADLSDEPWVSRLDESAMPYLTRGDKVVCAPTGGYTTLNINYNKTLFNKLGIKVPTNVKEFEAACETLKANGVIPIYMGSASGAGWLAIQLLNASWGNLIQANGDDLCDRLNNNSLKWSEVKHFPETVKMWENWAKKGYFNPNMGSDDAATGVKLVGEGKCGMIITGDWQWAEFNQKYPDVEIGGMVPPAVEGKNILPLNGPNGLYVSSTSKHVEAAKDLVAWLCEANQLKTYYSVKPDMSCWKDVKSEKMNPVLAELSAYLTEGRTSGHWGQFYLIPYAEDMSMMVFEMLSGQITADQLLEQWDTYMINQGKQLGFDGF